MKTKIIIVAILTVLVFSSANCEDDIEPPKEIRGCTDRNSLSYNPQATIDDGSCEYSIVTFYAQWNAFNYIPIMRIDVLVNGEMLGSITTNYPNGPGNCSAQGTVRYEFNNGRSVDWNTTVYLANGAIIYGSGQVSPNQYSECIKVNVTK